MRLLVSAKCFLFKLSYFKSPLSKTSLRNFKRTYIFGKFLFFKSFNAVRLRTKNFSNKYNLRIMSTLQPSTNNKLSIAETTKQVDPFNSVSTYNQCGRSSKEKEKDKSRRRSKESINFVKDINMENRKPISFTLKPKSVVVNPMSCTTPQNTDNKRRSNVNGFNVNQNRSSSIGRYNTRIYTPGNVNPVPNASLQFSNLVYLSGSHMSTYGSRFSAADYSNTTRASQLDKQQAWALRSWQRTSSRKFPESCVFKIMSYNVLAQELLDEHTYLYQYHNPNAIVWEQRWFTLMKELKYHNADILCLQEVQASHLDSHYSQLNKLGYKGIFKQRTGVRTDGCAIYYKDSVFKLVEHITVEFNQTNITVLNRDNVAIIAKFAPRNNTENEFVVATTHLLYNPRREDVRLAQTQVLLSEVDRMAYKPNCIDEKDHLPVIITGDFNLRPESAVYELITNGFLKYDHLTVRSLSTENTTHSKVTGKRLIPAFLRITDNCQHADLVEHRSKNNQLNRNDETKLIQLKHSERQPNTKSPMDQKKSLFSSGTLSHHFALQSAYRHVDGNDTEATTFQDKWVTVDYIFYSSKVNEDTGHKTDDKLKLLARYKLPITQQLRGVRIPNYAFGSDHFLLLVTFKLDA